MEGNSFDPDLIRAIFTLVWKKNQAEAGTSTLSNKFRPTFGGNANALKLSCEFLRIFVTEAIQRAAAVAEAECSSKIEATHLERVLPQLLLDF